ncbi:uncharacterized protein LOC127104925 [Lathyrus oleraceus]|uniref:uncharacterized protein LOC127104925 n=1 Tax=Pisum sativum TaxID=3888 RepID=UPI0021CE9B70|nr:uncharacterized protein LOC127104925 [Pisum sativum]
MQKPLKLSDDNSYVSRYRTYDDEVTVRDIFWNHLDSIKLLNTFLTMLILDPTYKTNKYKLPLLEMVGVTSTKKTYSVGFAFLECEKENNFTRILKVCRTLLKVQSEMPEAIVTDCDTALINSVVKVFPSSYALLYRYHITKNVRSQVKPAVGTKHIESGDGKMVKAGVVVASLNYIFREDKQIDNVGSDSAKCGCTIVKTYGLPCACVISKKVKLGDPIRMDEVCIHWKRLRFDDDGCMYGGKLNIPILNEWEVIQEIFLKAGDNIKLHIKEQLRKISYPETTDMQPPSQPVKTKGAPKKMKSTSNDNSITQSPSYF